VLSDVAKPRIQVKTLRLKSLGFQILLGLAFRPRRPIMKARFMMKFHRLLLLCLLLVASVAANAQSALLPLLIRQAGPTLSFVNITLPTVNFPGSAAVRMSEPAGVGGQRINLSSRTLRGVSPVVTVPGSLVIAAGQTQRLFYFFPSPTAVLGNQYTITATIPGGSSVTTESLGFTIPFVQSVTVSPLLMDLGEPGYFYGGKTLAATVVLNAPALAPGLVLNLSDEANTGALTLPATVTVPAGVRRFAFYFATRRVLNVTLPSLRVQDGFAVVSRPFWLMFPGVKRVSTIDTLVRVGQKVRLAVELDWTAAEGLEVIALSQSFTSGRLTADRVSNFMRAGQGSITLTYTATAPGVVRAGAEVPGFRGQIFSPEITIVE